MAIKIGFQGHMYSNSHHAAVKFSQLIGLEFEGVALINSYPVLKALADHEIDYGVVAYRNSTAGLVKETQDALNEFAGQIEEAGEIAIPIHHCLCVRAEDDSAITHIYSHEQALRQCTDFINAHYPGAVVQAETDTALAAMKLANGEYGKGGAVICNELCCKMLGLTLLHDHIETEKDNHTMFKVYAAVDDEVCESSEEVKE